MFAQGQGSEFLSFYTILVSQIPLSMVLISEHFLDLFSSPTPDLEQLFSAKNFPNSLKTIDPGGGKIKSLLTFDCSEGTVSPSGDLPHQLQSCPVTEAPCPILGKVGTELAKSLAMV